MKASIQRHFTMFLKSKLALGIAWVVVWYASLAHGFVVPSTATTATLHQDSIRSTTALYAQEENSAGGGGPLSFLFNPYESKIPKEIEKEIYEAEGNTPAAQDRSKRIALYAVIAFVGILMAFFNGFITELRSSPTPDGGAFSLQDSGFGWVESSFLTRFFFMNKIGGGILLLTGAGAGLLAEAEYDTRRINAERIYEEMVRRRTAKAEKEAPKKKKSRKASKEKKRIKALSEVLVDDETETETTAESEKETAVASREVKAETDAKPEKEGGGVFDSVKNFYQRADSMAASQALLLNKKLEDAGVLEKITDETGLKVFGRQGGKESETSSDEKTTRSS